MALVRVPRGVNFFARVLLSAPETTAGFRVGIVIIRCVESGSWDQSC